MWPPAEQQKNEQLRVQKVFYNLHQDSIEKKSQRGFRPCVCAHNSMRKRERRRAEREGMERERGGGSVKIISGFSVRMNFTTVSSHEII